MINICIEELDDLNMSVNVKKSSCLKIGARHNIVPMCLTVGSDVVSWGHSLRYLGYTLVSG